MNKLPAFAIRKPRGAWSGNQFWKQRPQRRGFVFSFRGLRNWQRNNPEESKQVSERFQKTKV